MEVFKPIYAAACYDSWLGDEVDFSQMRALSKLGGSPRDKQVETEVLKRFREALL